MTPAAIPVVTRLREVGIEVDPSERRTSEYAYDASNYRVRPLAVVFPRTMDDVVATVRACAATHTPIVSRGGGTSMAGNAVGRGVVVDFSRYMDRILEVDRDAGTVNVEPGVVLATLTSEVEAATGGELTFAPDPSSKNRATVGGAIGNDACGNHSVRYGRTSDHTVEIDVVTSDGARLTATATDLRATDPTDRASIMRAEELSRELRALAQEHLATFRVELGQIPRQVSGYHLQNLLPEKGFNVARALVGSEGTCALVVGARMRLVPKPASALLVCLGYDTVVDAARDVTTILEFSPAAVEGTDKAIVETMRWRRGPDSVRALPEGNAWLFVDLDGDTEEAVKAQADELLERLSENGRLVEGIAVPDPEERANLWRVREDGAGLSSRLATGGESWPGWEDSAVAPEKLADYLADLRELLSDYDLDGVMYGHFGAGCMHIRITFDLRTEAGREVYRNFTRDAAHLVVRHGGSLSGEHGDGRARSALLPIMYSPEVLDAFAAFRRAWDPTGLLNPGSIVEPESIDAHLALEGVPDREWRTSFDLQPVGAAETARESGQAAQPDPWVHAVQGCIGVGRCRADSGGVMCPSFRATHDEKDSTRGRARVLQDMVRGAETVSEGWKSNDVREALDLCLSCKACATDCPAGVDMATYKSEFFDHYYARRIRPRSHYSLGWLPRWLVIAGRIAPLINTVLATPLGRVAAWLGGLTTRRALPKFASAGQWRTEVDDAARTGRRRKVTAAARTLPRGGSRGLSASMFDGAASVPTPSSSATSSSSSTGGDPSHGAVLFVDTFTRGFRPEVAGAAARVLAGAGETVECSADVCCGLTWISTGQLGTAKKMLTRAASELDDGTDRPIVVIEPSCAAALRKDLPELVHTEQAQRVSRRVTSFAAYVTSLAGEDRLAEPARPVPQSAVVQTHCHEYSVFGPATQRKALAAAGVAEVSEANGCCGVAGNFGFEAEHYEVSMKVAETSLAPALRAAAPDTAVLTDGFSCAMQVNQLDPSARGTHIAEILDPGSPTTETPTTETPTAGHRTTGTPTAGNRTTGTPTT
ncbi:FAD-binding and (Fe-S)-binding domain-containing protein [Kocuria carniphila]|uniref:FAD-binding and (Fe-S)-binding domain-containing protein n=1 Tax=Kocuria carniphila TaxID=262208 RepID=UPI00101DE9AE|nr:FAD-binding and (Fe-S)-binding domain-containing protein [Kocuria carniphila]